MYIIHLKSTHSGGRRPQLIQFMHTTWKQHKHWKSWQRLRGLEADMILRAWKEYGKVEGTRSSIHFGFML